MATFTLTTGSDFFYGDGANDLFTGPSGGFDYLYGGGGKDSFELAGGSDGIVDGGSGVDTVKATEFDLGTTSFSTVEKLDLGVGGITATAAQLNSFSELFTTDGTADVTFQFSGAGGTVDFGALWNGNQTLHIDAYNAGNGTGYTFIGTDRADFMGGSNFGDTIWGGDGDDVLDTRDGTGDVLNGEGGNDILSSFAVDPTLDGGAGNDRIYCYSDGILSGGDGADRLKATLGNPIFDGGLGRDYLQAGTLAAETFLYASGADSNETSRDRIRNFDSANDSIDLWMTVTGVDATVAASGAHALDAVLDGYIGAGHAVLVTIGAQTLLVVDSNGIADYQAGGDFVVRVDGTTSIDVGLFI